MQQQWADYRVFWREFRRTFHTTGAVLPSGRALSLALSRHVRDTHDTESLRDSAAAVSQRLPYMEGRRILEVGPGTGAVTAHIIHGMRPTDRLTLVERNDQFVARLRQRLISDQAFQRIADRFELVHASVEDVVESQPYDLIISGLPLNNFPVPLVDQIMAKFSRLLAPQGTLSFFEYVAVRKAKSLISRRDERERLNGIGRVLADVVQSNEINRELVLVNMPPAWVHHVRFKLAGDRQPAAGHR